MGGKTLTAGSGYSTNDDATQLAIAVPSQSRVPATVSVTVTTDGGSAIYQLRVTASSLTSAAYNSDLKVITLNGASLGKLTGIKVTAAETSVVPATFTASLDGRTSASATLAQALIPGTHTVSGVDASRVPLSTTFVVSPRPPGRSPRRPTTLSRGDHPDREGPWHAPGHRGHGRSRRDGHGAVLAGLGRHAVDVVAPHR